MSKEKSIASVGIRICIYIKPRRILSGEIDSRVPRIITYFGG
jgi:hypothetical protein